MKNIFIIMSLILSSSVYASCEDKIINVKDGASIKEALHCVSNNSSFNPLPIGSIVAWHDYGELKLPDGWLICDGSTIQDKQSPLAGKKTPNLNSPSGKGRFLRGTSGKSGEYQSATRHPFVWATGSSVSGGDSSHNLYYPSVRQYVENTDQLYRTDMAVKDWKVSTANGKVITKSHNEQWFESRPASYTVKWIMRVK